MATYIDTFGDSSTEPNTVAAGAYEIIGKTGTPLFDGIMNSLSAYMSVNNTIVVSAALYTSAGVKVARCITDFTGSGAAAGWVSFSFPDTYVYKSLTYQVCTMSTTTGTTRYRSTGHTSGDTRYNDQTALIWPASLTWTNSTSWYSIYASYNPFASVNIMNLSQYR